MRKKLLVILFLLGLSIALLGNPEPSEAGTLIVDGNCTLVDAIIAANTDAPSGNCPAGDGDDIISLTVDVQFTEAYSGSTDIGGGQAALPDITSNITIQGNGHTLIGGGNGTFIDEVSFRLAYVTSSASLMTNNLSFRFFVLYEQTSTVQGGLFYITENAYVKLQNGSVGFTRIASDFINGTAFGGFVFNQGTLDIHDMYIFRAFAGTAQSGYGRGGAIYNTGDLTITASTFFHNGTGGVSIVSPAGGAIYSSGVLIIEETLFTRNLVYVEDGVAYGGVIAIEGATSITNSTVHDNSIEIGDTSSYGYGGAIVVNTTENVSILHSTLLNNRVEQGEGEIIYSVSGSPDINGTIIASNGVVGCFFCLIAFEVNNSDCFGPMSGSENLTIAGDTSCNAISSGTIELDTHVSTTLANNGGPTDTLALLPVLDNPAIDGNPNCGLLTDQRNYDRDINCDIGAFELNGVPPTATPTPTFTPTDTPTETPTPIELNVNAVCVDENLEVTIGSGETPFEISASGGGNVPVTVGIGTHTILGPDKWDNLTVTEQSGDGQSSNLGTFKCRTDERPVPLMPAHSSRTTNPFPTFSWTGISDANNYRMFVFDDKVAANRTVDIRQNSGGPTTMVLSTPLPIDRLFWRVRGRQNRVWSLWSIRFTLFVDPPTAHESVVTPVPTIDLAVPTSVPVPTIGAPDGGLTPAPTLIQPPNSR